MTVTTNKYELPQAVDVVVVGSGAAGLSAALTAAVRGAQTVVLEKSEKWGGTTARSGGGVWIPGNDVLRRHRGGDDVVVARDYLRTIIGDSAPPDLVDAYLDEGPAALRFLTAHSALDLEWVRGYSDYFPEAPGGRAAGRSCEPRPFDARRIGSDFETMQEFYTSPPMNMVIKHSDYRWLSTGVRHWRGPLTGLRVATRSVIARARRRRLVGLGTALTASLLQGLQRLDVPLVLGTGMAELLITDGRVTGVVTTDGRRLTARRGVVLACGGFDHNADLRRRHHRRPAGPDLSLGVVTNTGDALLATAGLDVATALLDDAWWAPSVPLPKGPWFALAERSLPCSIIVNDRGERFMNESLPYVEATHAMFGGVHGTGDGPAANLPAWLIFDQTYRDRYLFAGKPARTALPKSWFASGALTRADTLDDLGRALGLPETALDATVARFNAHARSGIDPDFHRGESAYDHYYGDITNKPNPSLGELTTGPFYAARLVPADLGTKGGLVTDRFARVRRSDGSVVTGLYAAGNAAAPVMGHTYAGPGATIGPALVFGHLAGRHLTLDPVREDA